MVWAQRGSVRTSSITHPVGGIIRIGGIIGIGGIIRIGGIIKHRSSSIIRVVSDSV